MVLIRYHLLLLTCRVPLRSVASPLDFLLGRSDKRTTQPVILDLPYGSYKSEYNDASDIHVFRNIPYAAPPVGELRWKRPAAPIKGEARSPGPKPTCPQAMIRGINLVGPGNESPVGTAINQFLAGIPIPSFGDESEDCLYMDIYVPSKALLSPENPLPVVVFIFGGGFFLGSKDIYQPQIPFYDGTGMISQSKNSIIFITFNYCLGAFGFLAGTSMEEGGLPNAGLWDQRAVFEWVQSYVHRLGGDPSRVTAMGESAGASSIMHHLVAEGGTLDPLFQRAILLSPAAQNMWDRAGSCEVTFQQFASLAGCEVSGALDCLRAADSEVLRRANKDLMLQQVPGTLAVGPTPDGSFIRQIPALELASGNFWPMESLVLSHCADEAGLFVDGSIATNADFNSFLAAVLPNYTESSPAFSFLEDLYPPVKEDGGGGAGNDGSRYATQSDRVAALVRDSSMTCNIHYLNTAYGPTARLWNMQYSVSPGWHGADLVAIFNHRDYGSSSASTAWHEILTQYILLPLRVLFSGISTVLQSYLVSYVLAGDPNTHRAALNFPPAIRWNHPRPSGDRIGNVLDVGNFLVWEVEDDQVPRAACDSWVEFYAAVVGTGGYVPPGGEVEQGLIEVKGNVSARY